MSEILSTAASYLQSLITAKNKLVQNLRTKGQNVSTDEPLTDLADSVINIHAGVEYGEWTPIGNTDTFSVAGIPFVPTKIAVSCDAVMTNRVIGSNLYYVGLLNATVETDAEDNVLTPQTAGITATTVNAAVTVTPAQDGTYTVTVSFHNLNTLSDTVQYYFKGYYTHSWVISSEEWLL